MENLWISVTVLRKQNAAAAKPRQLCLTLCDPIDGSLPGSTVPGIVQARTLEWVAISFSNAWKWKVKVKLLSRIWLFTTPWTAAYQGPLSMGFSRQEYWSGGAIAFSGKIEWIQVITGQVKMTKTPHQFPKHKWMMIYRVWVPSFLMSFQVSSLLLTQNRYKIWAWEVPRSNPRDFEALCK